MRDRVKCFSNIEEDRADWFTYYYLKHNLPFLQWFVKKAVINAAVFSQPGGLFIYR